MRASVGRHVSVPAEWPLLELERNGQSHGRLYHRKSWPILIKPILRFVETVVLSLNEVL